jgi:hypothetical protein
MGLHKLPEQSERSKSEIHPEPRSGRASRRSSADEYNAHHGSHTRYASEGHLNYSTRIIQRQLLNNSPLSVIFRRPRNQSASMSEIQAEVYRLLKAIEKDWTDIDNTRLQGDVATLKLAEDVRTYLSFILKIRENSQPCFLPRYQRDVVPFLICFPLLTFVALFSVIFDGLVSLASGLNDSLTFHSLLFPSAVVGGNDHEFPEILSKYAQQSRNWRHLMDRLLPLLRCEQDFRSSQQLLEVTSLCSALFDSLRKNGSTLDHVDARLMGALQKIEETLERLKRRFRRKLDEPNHTSGPTELIFEFPDNIRHVCTTMPWTIRPALLVLWGVCWMFIIGPGDGEPKGLDASFPTCSPLPIDFYFSGDIGVTSYTGTFHVLLQV